jgi:indole-3-glycerol phosphate synthase
MNFLTTIVEDIKKEVAYKKMRTPVFQLKESIFFQRKPTSLKEALNKENSLGIIAEFKRKSPSKGIINNNISLQEAILTYEQYASGISVLTNEPHFGAQKTDFTEARRCTALPLLRKDFIIDEYQVYEAKSMGADVILLIAACLSFQQINELSALSKELGMEVLLEIHEESELPTISGNVDIIGINNRNLKTFEVSVNTSLQLIKLLPKGATVISESGISNTDTIAQLKKEGFKGFLIGEYFMKQANHKEAFSNFIHQITMR